MLAPKYHSKYLYYRKNAQSSSKPASTKHMDSVHQTRLHFDLILYDKYDSARIHAPQHGLIYICLTLGLKDLIIT